MTTFFIETYKNDRKENYNRALNSFWFMKHLLPCEIKRKFYKRKSNFLRVKYELVFTDINIAKIKVTVSINIACLETTNNNSAIKNTVFFTFIEKIYISFLKTSHYLVKSIQEKSFLFDSKDFALRVNFSSI